MLNEREEKYAEHIENKGNSFDFLKNIPTTQVVIVGIVFILILLYFQDTTGKDYKIYIGLIISVVFIILFVSNKTERKNIDLEVAAQILKGVLSREIKSGNTSLPPGRPIVTLKGYPIPRPDYPLWIIYFYIKNPNGQINWFKAKIKADTGDFCGYESWSGDTSGKPPRYDDLGFKE